MRYYVFMSSAAKLIEAARNRPNNFKLDELLWLAKAAGFEKTGGKGSHIKMERAGVAEKLIIASHGGEVKAYIVRQLVALIDKYNLLAE